MVVTLTVAAGGPDRAGPGRRVGGHGTGQIINAFPLEGKGAHHGLGKFKKWIDGFDPLLDEVGVHGTLQPTSIVIM